MAKEIFTAQLEKLGQISKKLSDIDKKTSGSLVSSMNRYNVAMRTVVGTARTLENVFDRISGIVKTIGLAGLGISAAIGYKGLNALEKKNQAADLGIGTRDMQAIEYAGKQTQSDAGFYKNILRNINQALIDYPKQAANFAKLGMNGKDLEGKNAYDKILAVLQHAKESKLNPQLVNESLSSLTGISLQTLKGLNLDKLPSMFAEGRSYASDKTDQIAGIGMGVNRVFASFNKFSEKIIASVEPAFSSLFNNIAKGLNAISNNKRFNELMEWISKWAVGLSENFDQKLMDVIENLPSTITKMQEVFFRIIQYLARFAGTFTFGGTSRSAHQLADDMKAKADALENGLKAKEVEHIIEKTKEPTNNGGGVANINIQIKNDTSKSIVDHSYKQNLNYGGQYVSGNK